MWPEKLSEKFNLNRRSWSNLLSNFDWQEAREGVTRESRARILLTGLPGVGKSTLLNRLCGWTVSAPRDGETSRSETDDLSPHPVEDFGLFCLVDLPDEGSSSVLMDYLGHNHYPSAWNADDYPAPNGFDVGLETEFDFGSLFSAGAPEPLDLAEGADLLVYVLDGMAGVRPADYRWVGRLRRLGLPLLVVVTKCDLPPAGDLAARRRDIENRLAAGVLTVSGLTGANISDQLLPRMIRLCPNLTVALGRELRSFRQEAATRLIHRAALLNGLVALEPVPLIDLPVQVMTLTGLMLRIGAVYERPPSDLQRREVIAAVAGGLAGRLGAQQLAKLVPVVGWAASSIIGWSGTWALGKAAITYFEAGGDAAVDRGWDTARNGVHHACRVVYRRWQQRPRLRVEWGTPAPPEEEEHDG